MLQWIPERADEVIYNDREGGRFVSRVVNVNTGQTRTVGRAIYALSPDGTWAVATDFARNNVRRPGYGYPGLADPNEHVGAPADSGIWRIDLASGAEQLIFSLADAADLPWSGGDFGQAKHWFNHLLISPDGRRIELLHRWTCEGSPPWKTRMLTIAPDGGDVRVVDDSGFASHFIWDDPEHLLVCCKATGTSARGRVATGNAGWACRP